MSNPKITPKNLSYDSTLPPFLQRMQDANSSAGLDGRHERAIARPKRARTAQDEEDDMPLYIDESTGDVVRKDEFASLVRGDKPAEETQDNGDPEGQEKKNKAFEAQSTDKGTENLVGIGAAKKRKVGKLVAATDEEDDANITTSDASGKQDATAKAASKRKDAPKSKKAKKIKLSFNDDDGS